MSTNIPSLSRPLVPAAAVPAARPSLIRRIFGMLVQLQDRARERQHIAALDPRMLRDMGMTPDDVSRELGKLHWRR